MFGGSFNPPHTGHVHAAEVALKYLGLDAVWWMVSPGNPLKSKIGLPDTHTRIALCRKLVTNPRIIITDLESRLGTTRTYDTVTALQHHYPTTDFIWFSGTEIAQEFHHWHKWHDLQRLIPFAFVGRPTGYGLVRGNTFRRSADLRHIFPRTGIRPELEKGRIYWIFAEPLHNISSTALRGSTDPICETAPNVIE